VSSHFSAGHYPAYRSFRVLDSRGDYSRAGEDLGVTAIALSAEEMVSGKVVAIGVLIHTVLLNHENRIAKAQQFIEL
jgi:hypothetical protein